MFPTPDHTMEKGVLALATQQHVVGHPHHYSIHGGGSNGNGHVPLIALTDVGFFARYLFDNREAMSAQELEVAGDRVDFRKRPWCGSIRCTERVISIVHESTNVVSLLALTKVYGPIRP
ncbi:hypothetical protein C8Q78DRAFT_279650 [Trametes maxima]|nr:hypothetical protein C8Q78DRAFT_279650 [Trametes maxima]